MLVAMGTDNGTELIAHFINSARLHIDPVLPGFSDKFMAVDKIDELYIKTTQEVTQQHFSSGASVKDMLN